VPIQNPKRVLRDVGRRVAEIREAAGKTQEKFSVQLKVSLKYLQRVEAGTENLTVLSLAKLANRARVRVTQLFEPPVTHRVKRRGRPPKRAAPARAPMAGRRV
jgi:transcriptional regulator with XRE-family HTH domain